jgi:ribosomal protein S18 acetylase RimI-like enzyme
VIQVREAGATDLKGIGDVVKGVWDQEILPDVCRAQMENDACALWVAADRSAWGAVVGFVSAFATVDVNGHRRWELDLVAVRQDSHGQGIGTQLINRAYEVGASNEVSLARALIRVENAASQRAFEKAGFTTDGQGYYLMLWAPKPGAISVPCLEGVALLPVDTLTYRGLWIEGLEKVTANEQRSIIEAARGIIARDGRLNTGALIPAVKEHLVTIDLLNEATIHGEYYWFLKPAPET